jgi:hypothetical protein
MSGRTRAFLLHLLTTTSCRSQVLDAYQDVVAPSTQPRATSNAQQPRPSFDWDDTAPVVAERTTSVYTAHANVDKKAGAAAVAQRPDGRVVAAKAPPHPSHHSDVLLVDPQATHHLLATSPDEARRRSDDARLDWSDGVQATLVTSARQLRLRGLPPQPKPDWPEAGPRWLSQPEPQVPVPSSARLRPLRPPVGESAPARIPEQAEWGDAA